MKKLISTSVAAVIIAPVSACGDNTTDHKLLLEQLKFTLPPQPPPRIAADGQRVH